jgi:hypothetical protein
MSEAKAKALPVSSHRSRVRHLCQKRCLCMNNRR